jgi:hypothetical protein
MSKQFEREQQALEMALFNGEITNTQFCRPTWKRRQYVKQYNKEMRDFRKESTAIDKYESFYNHCACLFSEGVEFMTKTQIYDSIKMEFEKIKEDGR